MEIHEKDSEGYKRRDIGRLLVALGDFAAGKENLTAALCIADDLNIPRLKHTVGLDLARACLSSGKIEDAMNAMHRAFEFIVPRNAPEAHALMGVVLTRQRQFGPGRSEFEEAIVTADSLLAKAPDNHEALYAKAVSLAGLSLLGPLDESEIRVEEVTSSLQSCLDHCCADGVIKHVIDLLDTLESLDEHQVLSGPRSLLASRI